MGKLNVWQSQLGLKWFTYLSEERIDIKDIQKPIPLVKGEGWNVAESADAFVEELNRQVREGNVVLTICDTDEAH